MAKPTRFKNPENNRAFQWLTAPRSNQAVELENAMRNYEHPVYDPEDVGQHLLKSLLLSTEGGYTGDSSKIDILPLAFAVISHAIAMRWDVVEETGRT